MSDARPITTLASAAIVLILHAGAALSANVIDLATEPADFSILGEAVSDLLGRSMATGDINGDGYRDLVAVACNSRPLGGTRQGTLYIFWGDQLGQQNPLDLTSNPPGVSRVFGRPGDDFLMCNVATGDLNDDGYDDLIWGQPLTSDQANWAGKAYIILGGPTLPAVVDLLAAPPGVTTVYGWVEYNMLGRSACICDIDGDGYNDAVLTAPGLSFSEIIVVWGQSSLPVTIDAGSSSSSILRIVDGTPDADIQGVACRDINDDGYADVALGAIGDERVVLVYGGAALSQADTLLLSSPSTPVKVVLGEYSHGALGGSLAFADADNDGTTDLLAGAYHADPLGCYDCGEVYILYDADSLPDSVALATTAVPMTRVVGFGSSRKYGFQLLIDDVSSDQIDDVMLSNYPNNHRSTAVVLPGRDVMPSTILLATETGPIVKIHEVKQGDRFGAALASLDLDTDGVSDLLIGAHYADPPGRSNAGIIYGILSRNLVTNVQGTRPPGLTMRSYPNPFARFTTVVFEGVPGGDMELAVYDVRGRRVFEARLANHRAGAFEFVWDGRDGDGRELPSGVYFGRLQTGSFTAERKLVIVR